MSVIERFHCTTIVHVSFGACTCRSQAKAAVAYKYDKKKGGESDESEEEMATYHGDEGEDKTFSSESEYGKSEATCVHVHCTL